MAINIQDGLGSGYFVKVNPDGSINTNTTISSTLGSQYSLNVAPTLASQNPAYTLIYSTYSGTSIGLGSNLGSLVQFIGTGSYVSVLTYDSNNNLLTVGSWF